MTNKYNEFDKIINTKVSLFLKIRLFIRKIFDNAYMLPGGVHKGEKITAYIENGIIKSFFIGKIIELDGKKVFNLEYIHSFNHGYGSKLLFTFINKYNVNNILYIPSSSFDFWNKVGFICKENNIILKQSGENIKFQ